MPCKKSQWLCIAGAIFLLVSGASTLLADEECVIPDYVVSESTFGGMPKYYGSLGTLENLYVTTKTVGTYTEYTFNGKITVQKDEIKPVEKIQFVNFYGKPPVLTNSVYSDSNLCPATIQAGSKISTFTCTFSTKDNPSLNNATKLIAQYIPQGAEITLRSTLKAIGDLPTAPCKIAPSCDPKTQKLDTTTNTCVAIETTTTTPEEKKCPPPGYIDTAGKCVTAAESKKELCASGNYILLGGKGCGTDCGANQVAKMGMCVCQTNFIPDPAKPQNCIVNPALNQNLPVSAPSSGGGSCSLIRDIQ